MAMITVRVPKDIRTYKEKFDEFGGLTLRQLVSVALGVVLGGGLIYFGTKKFGIPMNDLSFIMVLVITPVGLIGFYQQDGLTFEQYAASLIRFVKSKKDLIFTSKNKNVIIPEEPVKPKIAIKRSIERAVIFDESDVPITVSQADEKLVTVKNGGHKPPKKQKQKKPSRKRRAEDKLLERAEEILGKRKEDPYYIFTKKEQSILRRASELKEKRRKEDVKQKSKPKKAEAKRAKKRKASQKTTLPLSVQEAIPYIADYTNGIFELTKGVYSKMYIMDDLNYRTVSQDKQVEIFALYSEFLNSFEEGCDISVYIDNRVVSKSEQERRIFYPMAGDEFDEHRIEYNRIMAAQMEVGRNEMVQCKYITATVSCETFPEASARFRKIDMQIEDGIKNLGSSARALTTDERLEILHDKLRKGHEGEFKVDFDFLEKQGISSKDYIAPAYMHWNPKNFVIDDEYYSVMYLNNLPPSLDDSFFADLVDNNFPLTATIGIQPLAQHEALKIVNNQRTGMEKNIINAQKKGLQKGYSPELAINRKLKDGYDDCIELYDDLEKKSQKMFFVSVLLMFSAPSKELLDQYEGILQSKVRAKAMQLQTLTTRQMQGFWCCLPLGVVPKLHIDRALTSESTAVFIPFSCQELFQVGGFYYGLNGVSRNLILLDRTQLPTPSGFVMGMSGSGKSFAVKREMLNVLLRDPTTPLLITDPENEYTPFVEAFGGEVIKISSDSHNYINPMEMAEDYGLDENDDPKKVSLESKKEKAIRKKSEYIMSIVTCMLTSDNGETGLNPQQKTFVDRCVSECYAAYLDSGFDREKLPNLKDLQAVFDSHKKESEEARLVAEGTAYYTTGSLDVFSHHSNVNLDNRIVSFNIRDLGKQLMSIGLLIVLDYIWNTMCENSGKNVRTYCYADEVHVLFKNKDSAGYLQQLYKRGRKYGLVITGITQDIGDLLRSEEGRGMVYNSNFLLLLRQASENIKTLAEMLGMSESQCEELRRAPNGSGLLKANTIIVPFRDKFPDDSYLYKLMSTNFNERVKEKSAVS
jgi:hypothetical protein